MNLRKLEISEFKINDDDNRIAVDFEISGDETNRKLFARILLNNKRKCDTIFFYGPRTNHESFTLHYKKRITFDKAKNIVEQQFQQTVFEYFHKFLDCDREKIIEIFNLNLIKNNS